MKPVDYVSKKAPFQFPGLTLTLAYFDLFVQLDM